MTSELKVDKISPASGTAGTIGDNGDTFTVPSGVTLDVASGATLDATGATVTGIEANLVKISSGNWSSGTDTLTFSGVFDGTYKTYLFYLNNIYASSDYRVSVQFERGGSFVTSGYYYACQGLANGNVTQVDSSSSSSRMVTNAANAHGGAAAKTYSLAMNIFDPYNSTSYTQISGKSSMWLASDATGFSDFVGLDPSAASVTGFRIDCGSGTIGANAPYIFYGLKS
jgi:hypothetical protein